MFAGRLSARAIHQCDAGRVFVLLRLVAGVVIGYCAVRGRCRACLVRMFWWLRRKAESLKSAYGEGKKGGDKERGNVGQREWRHVAKRRSDSRVAKVCVWEKKALTILKNLIGQAVPKKAKFRHDGKPMPVPDFKNQEKNKGCVVCDKRAFGSV